jgi:hypothetical protein
MKRRPVERTTSLGRLLLFSAISSLSMSKGIAGYRSLKTKVEATARSSDRPRTGRVMTTLSASSRWQMRTRVKARSETRRTS